MLFFKPRNVLVGSLIGLVSVSCFAEPTLTKNDLETFQKSNQLIQKARTMDAPAWMRQYDAKRPLEKANNHYRRWEPAAEQIANDSHDFVKQAIQNTYHIQDKSKIKTIDTKHKKDPDYH